MFRHLLAFSLLTFFLAGCSPAPPELTLEDVYEPVHEYGPDRDAAADIDAAVAEAAKTGRRVLLEVGGEWCIWCHYLDAFWEAHPDVTQFREDHFILVKINFSPENENEELLSRYPEIPGYPHIFVLNSEGSLLHSQGTAELEEGKGHSEPAVTEFLQAWAN